MQNISTMIMMILFLDMKELVAVIGGLRLLIYGIMKRIIRTLMNVVTGWNVVPLMVI
jgi:hypothetical protein